MWISRSREEKVTLRESLKRFFTEHPRLASWAVLSVGMVVLLVVNAPGALSAGQLLGLAFACIVLGGVCAWIISWE